SQGGAPGGAAWLLALCALLRRRRRALALGAVGLAACDQELVLRPMEAHVQVGPALLDFERAWVGERVQEVIWVDLVRGGATAHVLRVEVDGDEDVFAPSLPDDLEVRSDHAVPVTVDFLATIPGAYRGRLTVVTDAEEAAWAIDVRGIALELGLRAD